MGFEEVSSIRAGLAPRAKRRGHDHIFRYPRGKVGGRGGRGGRGGGDGWLQVQHGRIEAQKDLAARVALAVAAGRKQDSSRAHHHNTINHGSETSNGGVGRGNKQRDSHNVLRVDASASVAVGGRSTTHSPTSRAGGSSIGIGGVGRGDGSVGFAVHAAAVESVELFLGDFVPKVRPQALLAAATEAEKYNHDNGVAKKGSEKKVAPPASRWAAIGRAGKLSARATAVCAEEVS